MLNYIVTTIKSFFEKGLKIVVVIGDNNQIN